MAIGMFLKGQALASAGDMEEGLALMSGGIDGIWASGRSVGRTRNLALLAEACAEAGMNEQGLSLLREASATVEETGERHFQAEIERLQGELLFRRGAGAAEVERHFTRALEVARCQGARSLELKDARALLGSMSPSRFENAPCGR